MAGFEVDPLVDLEYEEDHPYKELLDEANKREFTELENSHCITVGEDAEGLPVIVFVPRLGFEYTNCTNDREKDHHLKRMLLLFIKKADPIVSQRYTLIYAHTSLSILSQQPLVYKYYKMLPRAYKKNVHKVFVLHPTFLIKTFFEMGVRWFVKDKFFKKLNFVRSLAELQLKLPPRCTVMPPSLLLYEHTDNVSKTANASSLISTSDSTLEYGSLFDVFDSAVHTIPLVMECMVYLRESNAYSVQGIFRLSMDESVRVLLKDRLSRSAVDKILIGKRGEEGGREALGVSAVDPSLSEDTSSTERESTQSSPSSRFTWSSSPKVADKTAGDSSDDLPILVVEGVHNVAGTLKTCFAMLTEPLFTFGVYNALLQCTKNFLASKDLGKWDKQMDDAVCTMPMAHIHTLKTLLSMFAEVVEQVETNLMDSANLGRVFAPTLLRSVSKSATNETQMTSAMQEMLLGGQLIARLIDRAAANEIPAAEEWGMEAAVDSSIKTIKSDGADNEKESGEGEEEDCCVGDLSKMRFGGER